jgi:imidazolonepropionase-like amidohydrolase
VHAERGITTRLGVAETLRQHFVAAREYMRDWDDYNRKKLAGDKPIPPRRDLKLDNLAAVLKGEIWLQAHCYRADEIEMLLKLSDEFGFKIGALQHVLEGYKVAPEIAARGFGASTFADFWGYKLEAYDGISFNAAAMTQWGVKASINSDSGERIRRLNLDAAKSLRYGGLTDDQCLSLITLNPAWQLGVDKWTGSLEAGKDADIGIWDAHPLSVYAKCVTTLVDGDVYFERKSDGEAVFGRSSNDRRPTSDGPASKAVAVNRQPSAVNIPAAQVSSKPSGPASFAIVNARIVPVSSPEIPRGTIVVQNGRITAVGADAAVPAGVKKLNARGLSVYPGFINAAGTLGLTEISSVPESQDLGEQGPLKAHIRAADAFNAHSAHVGVARAAGVTSALVTPRGQGWMGQASLMHTSGRTVEESTVAADILQGVSVSAGGGGRRGGGGGGGEGGLNPAQDAEASQTRSNLRQTVEKALDDAREYGRAVDAYKRSADSSNRAPKTDLNLAALVPFARKQRPVIMAASTADDVEQAVKFGADKGLQIIVTGGRDADRAAASLNKSGVPVIFTDLLGMPIAGDAYDKNFSAPRRLLEAGVKFCIATTEIPALALHAGLAAAFGLPKEEALKAITLYPAQILGVEKDLGSLEVGKVADLLITDGDPLEFKTTIKAMYVNGEEAPLTSRHRQLYDQFRHRK